MRPLRECVFLVLILLHLLFVCYGNHDAKRLYDDLLKKSKYNRMIRPVRNTSDVITVKIGMKMAQIINVDEKNQLIETNMWIQHEWEDVNLKWNPREYGGVTTLYVPSDSIWLPEIVLYNNADGDYTITLMTKATLNNHGKVFWDPPAIFKTYCEMQIRYFPFDMQECHWKFGLWSYDGDSIVFKHSWTDKLHLDTFAELNPGIDLIGYYRSQEWDLLATKSKVNLEKYPCCEARFPDVHFYVTIRRKTLYYTYNLIIPIVSLNLLTILTFFLPSDSGEKISLSISILLSLSIFQLLLMEIIPATSLTVPLLGSYILFTMFIVSLSVFISVITLNVNFRANTTHEMPKLTKKIFLFYLPRLLWMKAYEEESVEGPEWLFDDDQQTQSDMSNVGNPYRGKHLHTTESDVETVIHGNRMTMRNNFIGSDSPKVKAFCDACMTRARNSYPAQAHRGLDATFFVAKHMKDDDESTIVKNDWRHLAFVIDRIFLYVYLAMCFFVGIAILCNAPTLYDSTMPIVTTKN